MAIKPTDPVSWGPIGQEVYKRSFSRAKQDGTQETWYDTVKRTVEGNLGLIDSKYHEKDEKEKLFNLIYRMDMLPAGRHLWATGVPGRQYLNNCHSAAFNREDVSEHFTFVFDELMKGGGVGSNYSNKYINVYPPVYSGVDLHIVCTPSHPNYKDMAEFISPKYSNTDRNKITLEDSREGWCYGLRSLLRRAWEGFAGPTIIDVSMLRPKDAILRSFGGKSSGPEPLANMLTQVNKILASRIGQRLTSLDIMNIDHEISKAVVAGGIRRSSRMSIKHWADKDIFHFIKCKKDKDKQWTTNISVEVDDEFFRALRKGEFHAKKVIKAISKTVIRNGEPGAWNSSLSAVGEVEYPFTTNPCGEIPFSPWDVCCLGHINLERFVGRQTEALEAFRLMTRFLIRATFGDILNAHQKEAVQRNRRIGVGFFGYHNWLAYRGVRFSESHHKVEIREKLRKFRDVCRAEARKYAFELRIPEPIKVTCIAPTGTISNLPGATSGCQPIFARYFIRRVRYSSNDDNLAGLAAKGYHIEDSVNEPNTKIVSYYCKDPIVDSCEKRGVDPSVIEEQAEISLSDHMDVQKMLQQEYADNAISYTINFNPAQVRAGDIEKILKIHLPHLKGTTLMPEGNSRPQMPLERITKEQFEEAQSKGLAMVSDAERECQNGVCPIK